MYEIIRQLKNFPKPHEAYKKVKADVDQSFHLIKKNSY
jgi:hypothetical protein